MGNLDLDISHIIFEKGVEVHRDKSGWLSTRNCQEPVMCEPSQILANYHLRPIVLTVNLTPSMSHCFLAPASEGRFLDIKQSELIQIAPFQNHSFVTQTLNLSYIVGAVIHHCHRLAQAYVNVCQNFSRFPYLIQEIPSPCVYSDEPEPYYEFEALITTARRFYETARYPIWTAFGTCENTPRSFERALAGCTNMPSDLRERLEQSWNVFGEKLKDYRDCIAHYIQLGGPIPFALMERLDNQLWTTFLRIPDNPQARSAKNFRYDYKLDALTYGWTVTNEIVNLAQAIIKQLPNDKGYAKGELKRGEASLI